jgi:hypothetical protein
MTSLLSTTTTTTTTTTTRGTNKEEEEEENILLKERNQLLLFVLRNYPNDKIKLPHSKFSLEEEEGRQLLRKISVNYVLEQMNRGAIVDLSVWNGTDDDKGKSSRSESLPPLPAQMQPALQKPLPVPSANRSYTREDASKQIQPSKHVPPLPAKPKSLPPKPVTNNSNVVLPPPPPLMNTTSDSTSSKVADTTIMSNVNLSSNISKIYPDIIDEIHNVPSAENIGYFSLHNNVEHDRYKIFWGMSADEIKISSYETFLLSCSLLTELKEQELSVVFDQMCSYYSISKEAHRKIMKNLLISPALLKSVNFLDNPFEYGSQVEIAKKFANEFIKLKSLMYRWELIKSYNTSIGRERASDFYKRQAKIFLNGFIVLIRESNASTFSFNGDDMSLLDFESILLQQFENLAASFDKEDTLLPNLINEIDTCIYNTLEKIKFSKNSCLPYRCPLNIKLYECLVDTKVYHATKIRSNVDDSELDIDSDEDILENENTIEQVLTYPRKMLDISNALGKLCLIHSLFNFVQNGVTYSISLQLEHQMIRELEHFSQFDEVELDHATTWYKSVVLDRILTYYGSKLTDIFDCYADDTDLLKVHLKLYYTALKRCIKHSNFESVLADSIRYMIRTSTSSDYERMREEKFKKLPKDDIQIPNFVDIDHGTQEPIHKVSLLCQFSTELCEELDVQIEYHYVFVDLYYKGARIEAILAIIELYSKEIIQIINERKNISNDIIQLFQGFRKLIEYLSYNVEKITRLGNKKVTRKDVTELLIKSLRPLCNSTQPVIHNWITKLQERFTVYMERSLSLEKWVAMSDENKHSSSLVDLFTFLEQPLSNLYGIVLPDMAPFYRGYAQCVSGIVQRYCDSIVKDLPSPQNLIPPTPKIPKPKNRLERVLANPSKKKKKDLVSLMEEERRIKLGNRFGYEELFVRLNNLSFARKKFIILLEDIEAEWRKLRSLFLFENNNKSQINSSKEDENSSIASRNEESDTESRQDSISSLEQETDSDTSINCEESLKKAQAASAKAANNQEKMIDIIENINLKSTISGTGGYIVSLIEELCEYIGTRNIYIELFPQLFKRLYIPSVDENRLEHVLERNFDPCMESLYESVSDGFSSELVMKAMFRKLIRALYTIILDGGPERCTFKPTDAPLLLKDLEAIERFFYSDGAGIRSLAYIRKYTAKLKAIIGNVMDKSTTHLLSGSSTNERFDLLPEKDPILPDSPWTKQIVFRVLYHRIDVDPIARKWFEKYKLRHD